VSRLVILALVGTVAQLVDGSLGMAYGVTSTTLLLSIGTAPALASASVHMAEIGTTLMAGLSHSRFGNVDWRAVGLMTFPGAGGAFLGAVVLSSLDGEVAKPWVAAILAGLGLYVLWRFLGHRKMPRSSDRPLPAHFLLPLGLSAGFIDAVGGGGWGPVGTPTLLASGRLEPRKVVGTVDTGEFLVALGASLGFLLSLSWSEIPLPTVGALLAGGAVAAPLAAYLVRAISPRKLGVLAGAAILLTNARSLALSFDMDGVLRVVLYGAILLALSGLAGWRLLQVRRPRIAARLAGQGRYRPEAKRPGRGADRSTAPGHVEAPSGQTPGVVLDIEGRLGERNSILLVGEEAGFEPFREVLDPSRRAYQVVKGEHPTTTFDLDGRVDAGHLEVLLIHEGGEDRLGQDVVDRQPGLDDGQAAGGQVVGDRMDGAVQLLGSGGEADGAEQAGDDVEAPPEAKTAHIALMKPDTRVAFPGNVE
jgi:uncharacterized membrane protein YfcA